MQTKLKIVRMFYMVYRTNSKNGKAIHRGVRMVGPYRTEEAAIKSRIRPGGKVQLVIGPEPDGWVE